jgi:hypothetical protein
MKNAEGAGLVRAPARQPIRPVVGSSDPNPALSYRQARNADKRPSGMQIYQGCGSHHYR